VKAAHAIQGFCSAHCDVENWRKCEHRVLVSDAYGGSVAGVTQGCKHYATHRKHTSRETNFPTVERPAEPVPEPDVFDGPELPENKNESTENLARENKLAVGEELAVYKEAFRRAMQTLNELSDRLVARDYLAEAMQVVKKGEE